MEKRIAFLLIILTTLTAPFYARAEAGSTWHPISLVGSPSQPMMQYAARGPGRLKGGIELYSNASPFA